jgi:hypothetical protein
MTFIIGTPHRRNAGYLINNQGLSVNRGRQEADVQTCAHCQRIINMQKWAQDGAFCKKCWAPICGNENPLCVRENMIYGCVPFLKRIEQFTNAQIKFRQYLKMAGLEPVAPTPSIIVTG